jgi:hypothetical protein
MHIRDYVEIDYLNWRGERRKRIVRVIEGSFRFGANDWHTDPQYLFKAYCVESGDEREFAMSGLYGWRPVGSDELRKRGVAA